MVLTTLHYCWQIRHTIIKQETGLLLICRVLWLFIHSMFYEMYFMSSLLYELFLSGGTQRNIILLNDIFVWNIIKLLCFDLLWSITLACLLPNSGHRSELLMINNHSYILNKMLFWFNSLYFLGTRNRGFMITTWVKSTCIA